MTSPELTAQVCIGERGDIAGCSNLSQNSGVLVGATSKPWSAGVLRLRPRNLSWPNDFGGATGVEFSPCLRVRGGNCKKQGEPGKSETSCLATNSSYTLRSRNLMGESPRCRSAMSVVGSDDTHSRESVKKCLNITCSLQR